MPEKTPLLDDLIKQLKNKKMGYTGTLEKAIETAKELKAERRKYSSDSPEWEIQYEKYAGQLQFIDGYIRALFDCNFIRSYNKLTNIQKEIRNMFESPRWGP